MSESISNPKFIDNRKYYLSQQEKDDKVVVPERSEAEVLIYNVKPTNRMFLSVVFNQGDMLFSIIYQKSLQILK